MIQGVGTRHASHSRPPNEARTRMRRVADPAMVGSSSRTRIRKALRPGAACSVAKPDLAERTRNLTQLTIVLAQPEVGNDSVLDKRAARAFLKSAHVQLYDTIERMHLLDIVDCPTRHLSP